MSGFSLDSNDDDGVRPVPASDDPSPFTLAARTEDADRLARSLQTLEPVYREVRGITSMNIDQHENFQHMIDESLAGGVSAEREQFLREHLDTCAPCQEYLSASIRVIAGLGGFSFEVGPTLNARVLASLRRPAQRVQAAQPGRRRWALISVAAVVLTIGGSFFDLQFGALLASVFDIQRIQVRQVLLAFWIVPSLCVLLLFPLLPLLSKAGTRREEGIL